MFSRSVVLCESLLLMIYMTYIWADGHNENYAHHHASYLILNIELVIIHNYVSGSLCVTVKISCFKSDPNT
jgi:hypothetical protein